MSEEIKIMPYHVRSKDGKLKFVVPNSIALRIIDKNVGDFNSKELIFGKTTCYVFDRSFELTVGRADDYDEQGCVLPFYDGDYMHKEK
jgi:hypothetical protein